MNQSIDSKFIESQKVVILKLQDQIKLDPSNEDLRLKLANSLWKISEFKSAFAVLDSILQINPNHELTHLIKGFYFQDLKQISNSIAYLDSCYKKFPNSSQSLLFLAEAKSKCIFTLDDSFKLFKKYFKHVPDDVKIISSAITAYHYMNDFDFSFINNLKDTLVQNVSKLKLRTKTKITKKDKLNIGFISYDFHAHPVGFIFNDFIKSLEDSKLNIFSYCTNYKKDYITASIAESSTKFIELGSLDLKNMTKQIIDDEIDILFDLNGFTTGQRLDILRSKPAPIQISWLGFVGSTRIPEIDYVLADKTVISDDELNNYSEKPLQLDSLYFPIELNLDEIKIKEAAYKKNSFITFACTNKSLKVGPKVIALWSKILNEIPDSRLIMLGAGFHDDQIVSKYKILFNQFKVDLKRIHFMASINDRKEYFDFYNNIDIALDPFPYGGGTVAIETVNMGVPLITLEGKRWEGRVSSSVNRTISCEKFIAQTEDEYFNNAVNLARNPSEIDSFKENARSLIKSSQSSFSNFAKQFENKMFEIWQTKCNE